MSQGLWKGGESMPAVKNDVSLEQVLQEHKEIRSHLANLREFLEKDRPEIGEEGSHRWAAKLSASLVSLHDQLFRHFRYEDRIGFFDKLEQRHPRSARQVASLRVDHDELLAGVRDIMNDTLRYSEGSKVEDPRLRVRLTTLLDRLGTHEEIETDLLQRMEYRDLGAGD